MIFRSLIHFTEIIKFITFKKTNINTKSSCSSLVEPFKRGKLAIKKMSHFFYASAKKVKTENSHQFTSFTYKCDQMLDLVCNQRDLDVM